MRIETIILLLIFCSQAFGQQSEDGKYQFAKDIFNSEQYKSEKHPKYDGDVKKIGNSLYKFGDKKLNISVEDTSLLVIFQKGIFNPDVIFGKETTIVEQAELDTMSQSQRVLYNLFRNDSLLICCFQQLDKLNPNAHTKRFSFWVFSVGIANPTEYYLELQNDKSNNTTSLHEFLNHSIMTFHYKGTIII